MPIVITPQGEYIDSVTGNPVNMPPSENVMREGEVNQMLDPRSVVRESEMSQMNNMMRFGMDIAGGNVPQSDITDIDKVRLLMDMGLNEVDAIEAVVREKSMGTVRPEEFSGARESAMRQKTPMTRPSMPSSGMGALPGVPMGGQAPMPMPRPEDLMISQPSRSRDNTYNPRDALNPFNAPNT